jgi:hypothetical protein
MKKVLGFLAVTVLGLAAAPTADAVHPQARQHLLYHQQRQQLATYMHLLHTYVQHFFKHTAVSSSGLHSQQALRQQKHLASIAKEATAKAAKANSATALGNSNRGVPSLRSVPSVSGVADLPSLNRAVLAFAQAHLGQKMGNGQCWTLADQALLAAGGQRPGQDGYGLYQFGRPLQSGEAMLPGDIMQFFNARFAEPGGTYEMPLHTAIIQKVQGTTVTLLNQNVNGRQVVIPTTLDLAGKTQGTVTTYRPQPMSTTPALAAMTSQPALQSAFLLNTLMNVADPFDPGVGMEAFGLAFPP